MTKETASSCEHTAPALLEEAAQITAIAASARDWLLEKAAPLWSTVGRTSTQLFAERILFNGDHEEAPYRVFVQARHIFSFVEIGRMGWDGPWRELISGTIDVLLNQSKRNDGFYVHSLNSAGHVHDGRADLYDQAFVLFALGKAGETLSRPELFDEAKSLIETLDHHWALPAGGYSEGEIVNPDIRRQNPHMHLLEAFLTLAQASGQEHFYHHATKMASLCRDHFIDAQTGALTEYFDTDWRPVNGVNGRIVEPGHCFEWAWLFEKMAEKGWRDGEMISDRLVQFARKSGIDRRRNVAINEVLLEGLEHKKSARLWPQTERLKAATARYKRTKSSIELNEVFLSDLGLRQYFLRNEPGLWRDKFNANGTWEKEPAAPGSSFYHITCGYSEIVALANQLTA